MLGRIGDGPVSTSALLGVASYVCFCTLDRFFPKAVYYSAGALPFAAMVLVTISLRQPLKKAVLPQHKRQQKEIYAFNRKLFLNAAGLALGSAFYFAGANSYLVGVIRESITKGPAGSDMGSVSLFLSRGQELLRLDLALVGLTLTGSAFWAFVACWLSVK